ncbi:hypothetical protein N7510_004625 [Penicillium lagena]|uniref:uncharacterized protein n=1 Tax=Penicillium lagena TaxID=94218 RepID=UPI0025421377|nr:uncharacterized protein N7510_004625 [Penicillium lagena]KAJ5620641.1 hypothetical protein N7510_004625 [Penicillium lagena]
MPSATLTFRHPFSHQGVTTTTPAIDVTTYNPNPAPAGSCWTAPFRDGLPTPPSDMTGLTYNAISSMAYGGKPDGIMHGHARPFDSVSSSMVAAMKPQNPTVPVKEAPTMEPANNQKKTTSTGGSQLRIPSSINGSKGSLAEFAAQMTCLFWFEQTSKLQAIEDRLHPVPSLVPEAMPTVGFQKWVASILSTTQVSQNVILLALLFVYRLKKFNSGVKGKKGSEFRLMTVALMLGNKFLDDNTYTNKTWAEVSGIAVHEIHIMEVEFLSNIRYDLFASKAEWARWHTLLGLFGDFFSQASMLPLESEQHTPMLRVSPPPSQSPLSSKLPSPPATTDLPRPQSQPNWYMPVHGLPPYGPSSLQPQLETALGTSRKRSRDDLEVLHPAKRPAISSAISAPALTMPSSVMTPMSTLPPVMTPTSIPTCQAPMAPVSRLPLPNLPPSSHPVPQAHSLAAASQLPTLMPPIYNRTPNWTQQMPPLAIPPVSSGGFYTAPTLPELGRHHPNALGVSSATVSPAVSAYSVHTPQTHLSPSFFLANRNSPYRPVRSVHTLLIPPPSTSMQQQRSVPFDHMHYQPLGKTSADRKTGLLPFIQPEAWNQGPHFPQSLFPPTQGYTS